MNDLIRNQLRDLIAHQGQALCLSPERCKAALSEICGQNPAEQYVLSSIVDLGLVPEILNLKREADWLQTEHAMILRLQEERALQPEAARWGLQTWALALGKIRDHQLNARMSEELGAGDAGSMDRRLLGGLLTGGVYGLLLWVLGWVVTWGLRGIGEGALVGAAVGGLHGLREVALSPWLVLGWALGGAVGVVLFQGAELQSVAPLTGAAAAVLAGALARAVRTHLRRDVDMVTPQLAVVGGITGPALGWPTAGLITVFAVSQFDVPWSWCVVGFVAGTLYGFLEGSRRSGGVALVQAVITGAAAGLLGLSAGLIGEQAGPFAWVIAGAVLWAITRALYPPPARHSDAVACVTFAPNAHVVLSASHDGTVGLWHIAERRLIGLVRQQIGPIHAVAFSQDGQYSVCGGADGIVRLIDGATGEQVVSLSGHTAAVLSVALSPGGGNAASGSADATVRIWDLDKGDEIHCLHGHTAPVTCVLFDRGGDLLSASQDGSVRTWDGGTGALRAQLDVASPVHAVALVDRDRRIVVAAENGLRLWDVSRTEPVRELVGHTGPVYCVAVHHDSILSGGADGTVRLWNRETGGETLCIRGHKGAVRSVAVAPTGQLGISGGDDGAVRFFTLPSADTAAEQ
jgi:hypothetical protein